MRRCTRVKAAVSCPDAVAAGQATVDPMRPGQEVLIRGPGCLRVRRTLRCLAFVNAALGKLRGFGTVAAVIVARDSNSLAGDTTQQGQACPSSGNAAPAVGIACASVS